MPLAYLLHWKGNYNALGEAMIPCFERLFECNMLLMSKVSVPGGGIDTRLKSELELEVTLLFVLFLFLFCFLGGGVFIHLV